MNLAATIADTVHTCGVERTFGLLGGGNLRLVHHLVEDHGIAFHNARHESAALGAADGYSRASGKVGVCVVTQGPGLTNTVTALMTALRARTPLVVLAGDSSRVDPAHDTFTPVQALDQTRLAQALGVPSNRIEPSRAGRDVCDAFATARRSSSPVLLNMPVELETLEAVGGASHPVDPVAPAVEPEAIALVVDELRRADRTVILAGLGAVRACAKDPLERLAEQADAILATSLRAAGLFAGNPRYVGIAGGFSTPAAREGLEAADCILAFGASLNQFTTLRWTLFSRARVIHFDTSPAALEAGRADIKALGDAALAAKRLIAELERWGDPHAARHRHGGPQWAGPADVAPADVSEEGSIDPRALCDRLDAILPVDRSIVTDGGHCAFFPVSHLSIAATDALHYMLDFGATGGGLGAAIGAALARPERHTTLFIGDGGLMMTLGDLDLAVRDGVPLLVVCMNDRAYGSEIRLLDAAGLPRRHALFETPNLAAVARAIGVEAFTVTRLEQLDDLEARIVSLTGPLMLECMISAEVVSPVMGELAAGTTGSGAVTRPASS